jgi:Holliday junction resolvase-like predicted endonuclease
MKKFSESQMSIFDSTESLDFKSLFKKIESLQSWIFKSNGLGMMSIIDDIFKEYNYETPLNQKQIDKFNQGIELLKKTSMSSTYIDSQLSYKIPGGIRSAKLVLDENGDWHHVNKLNTNYSDLSELLVELIKRGCDNNYERGKVVYDAIIDNPSKGLLSIKPHLKNLIIHYFIKNGNGLDDFKKFTNYSIRMSKIGEEAEDNVIAFLQSKGVTIAYSGGNGDFLDMIFGTDIIVFLNNEYKTVQVKNRINDWNKLSYYKVDWVAETNPIRVYNLNDRSIVDL